MSADKGSVQSDTLAALKAEANQLHKKIREERRKLNDADCKKCLYFKLVY